MYTKEQLKDLLRQQRHLCAQNAQALLDWDDKPIASVGSILNAPEPELPEAIAHPNSVEGLIQKWEQKHKEYEDELADFKANNLYYADGYTRIYWQKLELADRLADLKALAVQPTAFERLKAKVTPEHREAAKQELDRLEGEQSKVSAEQSKHKSGDTRMMLLHLLDELHELANVRPKDITDLQQAGKMEAYSYAWFRLRKIMEGYAALSKPELTEQDIQKLAAEYADWEKSNWCDESYEDVLHEGFVAGYKAAKGEQP